MDMAHSRFAGLIGEESLAKLGHAKVIVFGLGGVGGNATEALARAGVGTLHLVDNDTINESNLNRQLFATYDTVGMAKTDAARIRVRQVAPHCTVEVFPMFYDSRTMDAIDLSQYDYIVDAIDTVKSKLLLIQEAYRVGTPIISCMGTGNKWDPSHLTITDISKTSVCPLARVMRTELRKIGISHLTVVYSQEPPMDNCALQKESAPQGRPVPGSTPFVPSAAGYLLASRVVGDIIGLVPHKGNIPAHLAD